MKKFTLNFLASLVIAFFLLVSPQITSAYYVDDYTTYISDPSNYGYENYYTEPQYEYQSYEPQAPEFAPITRVEAAFDLDHYIQQAGNVSGAYNGIYGNPIGIRNNDLYQTMIWIGRSEDEYYDQGVASDVLTVANYARENTTDTGDFANTYSPLTGQQMYEVLGATYTMTDYYTSNGEDVSDQQYLEMLRDYTERALGR